MAAENPKGGQRFWLNGQPIDALQAASPLDAGSDAYWLDGASVDFLVGTAEATDPTVPSVVAYCFDGLRFEAVRQTGTQRFWGDGRAAEFLQGVDMQAGVPPAQPAGRSYWFDGLEQDVPRLPVGVRGGGTQRYWSGGAPLRYLYIEDNRATWFNGADLLALTATGDQTYWFGGLAEQFLQGRGAIRPTLFAAMFLAG